MAWAGLARRAQPRWRPFRRQAPPKSAPAAIGRPAPVARPRTGHFYLIRKSLAAFAQIVEPPTRAENL
jgi:hypothetical protein